MLRVVVLLAPMLGMAMAAQSFINITFSYQGAKTTVMGLSGAKGRSFLGLPYAAPPIGPLRFKPAQAAPLSRFVDATTQQLPCAQHLSPGAEDCLRLNIYTPLNSPPTAMLPVYFYIHGGGLRGTSRMPDGLFDNLVNRGPMIIVTLDHRLGPFGFFSTREQTVPGNAGMSDWIVALQWVQGYIGFFGGDPKKVTLGGEGAGAISVSFITMYPKANIAVRAGCATIDQWNMHDFNEYQKIMTCLRGKSMDEILAADAADPAFDAAKWGLVPDPEYLPDRLETLALKRRPVPVMHGSNNQEWLFMTMNAIRNNNLTGFTRNYVTEHMRTSYHMGYWDNSQAVFNAAKHVYFDSMTAADDDHIAWCLRHLEVWTEWNYLGITKRDAYYFLFTGSPVYLFAVNTYPVVVDQMPKLRAVAHTMDLSFLFNFNYVDGNTPLSATRDKTIAEQMGKLWTNFIRTGNPTPKTGGISMPYTWEKLDATDNYLSITDKPMMAKGYFRRSNFWVCNATAIDGFAPPYCPLM